MKTHAIIPVFLPHSGCPHDCIFCNQKKITAKLAPIKMEDVAAIVEQYLLTINGRGIETVEIAFFGGSFTGMPIAQQEGYLSVAKRYKDQGLIHKIRLSTRPDYISESILDMLKIHSVDIIELGVQSFDDEVLRLSNRGHASACVYKSSALIKAYGFELGIQLMIGLPGDSYEKAVRSAQQTVEIGPAIARIYPTIIIKDTGLESQYLSGCYQPLALSEAVRAAKDMFLVLDSAGIKVIRMGLKSSDHMVDGKGALGNTFHPAFRQLVDSELAKEAMESQLKALLKIKYTEDVNNLEEECQSPSAELVGTSFSSGAMVIFYANKASFSNMVGHQKSNKDYFGKAYPEKVFMYKTDDNLSDHCYRAVLTAASSASAP